MYFLIIFFFKFLIFIFFFIPILFIVAFLSLAERKVMGSIQRRRGPNVVGLFGILQPFSDGIKLFLKETSIPSRANKFLFIFCSIFSFSNSLFNCFLIPVLGLGIVNLNLGVLAVLGISSLGVYSLIFAGWSSNSKYAFYGSLRAICQMISYEVVLSVIILPVVLLSQSLNFCDIVLVQHNIGWFIFFIFPSALCFLIVSLAETNRIPFDLPEAEGELVAGYNVEYSALLFAFFFLAEYLNIIIMSFLFSIFYLGGWNSLFNIIPDFVFFSLKVCLVLYFFIWIRAVLPRYRFDQLIELSWRILLPFNMCYFFFIFSICTIVVNFWNKINFF